MKVSESMIEGCAYCIALGGIATLAFAMYVVSNIN